MDDAARDFRPQPSDSRGTNGPDTRDPTADDAVDGVMPKRVVQVRSADDIVKVMRSARAQRDPLIVRGGGTRLSIGNPPRALGSLVAMDAMDRILSYSPEDMVVTVEAGMTLTALDRELAGARQRVALEAPDPQMSTIGGLAAANFNSGIAYGLGYPRDQILGMTVVDGIGRVLRAGGRVVKNVAGYDMPRLFVGSFGTLAVITDVTLRTQPRPDALEGMEIDFTDEVSMETARQRLFGSRLPLRSLDIDGYLDCGRARWRMRVTAEGTTNQVEYVRNTVTALVGKETRVVDPTRTARTDSATNFVARFASAPSSAIREAYRLLITAQPIVGRARVVLECGGAILRLLAECRCDGELATLVAACQERCSAGAGSLLFERVPSGYKPRIDVWHGPIRGLSLMRRLKEKFDPDAVLAPGRFVGGL